MRYNVLGVSGLAGAGKSTLCNYIRDLAPNTVEVQIHPMAAALKRVALQYGWDGVKDEKGRRLLQSLGQTFRDYDDKTWLREWYSGFMESVLHASIHTSYKCLIAIVDDMRHHNEAGIVKQLGGTTLRLEGRGGLAGAAGKHESEIHIMNLEVDKVYHNDRDINHLEERAKHLVQELLTSSHEIQCAFDAASSLRSVDD